MTSSTGPRRSPARRGAATAPRRFSGLLQSAERLLPWLVAAMLAAGCNLAAVVLGVPLTSNDQAAMLMVLAGTLAAAGLLASRSSQEMDANDLDERARPAPDELRGIAVDDPVGAPGGPAYLGGMQRWTTALLDLLEHALEDTTDPERSKELTEAAEDTRALRDLLQTSGERGLSLSESAMLHSVVTLWEADQDRLESLAAEVDPRWHRRWRARSVIERQMRHGRPPSEQMVLPYSS